MSNKIKYKDIMDLGFKEVFVDDSVYFNQYGYQYTIISLDLTKRISLDWAKETQICEIIKVDKSDSIISKKVIKDLELLKDIIDFFKC